MGERGGERTRRPSTARYGGNPADANDCTGRCEREVEEFGWRGGRQRSERLGESKWGSCSGGEEGGKRTKWPGNTSDG